MQIHRVIPEHGVDRMAKKILFFVPREQVHTLGKFEGLSVKFFTYQSNEE